MALTAEFEKKLGRFFLQVRLEAEQGEILARLGASGSGKSMTLRCIAGIERPDRGPIELDGRVLFDSEKRICLPPQDRRVGYLFQQYALFPHMTAEQNIAAGALGLEKARRKQRTAELAALLRLEDVLKKRPCQLSGGQQQRVALARLLAAEPAVILLDEPLSALDSWLRLQLEAQLRGLLGSLGSTALWVTHDRGEALRNCRRVCLLENGRAAPVREMSQLMADPGSVGAARLCGCAALLPVRPGRREGWVEIPCWSLSLRCAAPWRAGTTCLGIPEGAPRPGGSGENTVNCRVERAAEDLSQVSLLLRPEGAEPDAPLLPLTIPRERWGGAEYLTVTLPAERLWLLS